MTESLQTDPIAALLISILEELRSKRAQDDDLWEAEHIANYMKLSKKSVQNSVLKSPSFPGGLVLPTGGRRWVAKEVKAWVLHRRR